MKRECKWRVKHLLTINGYTDVLYYDVLMYLIKCLFGTKINMYYLQK